MHDNRDYTGESAAYFWTACKRKWMTFSGIFADLSKITLRNWVNLSSRNTESIMMRMRRLSVA